mgnify:CR=1 FL=1
MYVTPEQIQVPIVGLEPSCLLTLRDEFLVMDLGGQAQEVARQALMFEEWAAAEARAGEWNENFVSILDKAVKNAPAGSDVAVTAVKQMIAAANSAYDNLN